MAQNNTLRSLEARMDEQLHAFGYGPSEEEKRNGSGRLIGAAALGTAGAVGYAKRKQIAGGIGTGMGAAGDALRKRASLGPRAAVMNPTGVRKVAGQAGDLLLRGAKKMKGFHDVEAIIELAERVAELELEAEEEIIEFEKDPNRQRGAIGTYMAGGPVALYDRKKYRESGLALRKRDAAKDSVKGSLAGNAASLGVSAGILGGAAGLGALAAKGKLPKGMLRKAGVKAGQSFKKASPKLAGGAIVAGGLAGLGTGMKVQHGSAEKRRKKLLMDRLQGAE